jgi:hypothetical protein
MAAESFPDAINPEDVGSYPALVAAGGGYVWDALLEYRVWLHPERGARRLHGGNDYFHPFARYADAAHFSAAFRGTEQPLALVLQEEHIAEPAPGEYVHVLEARSVEWPVELLRGLRRTPRTIPDFLAADGPARRLDILHGDAGRRRPRRG